MESKVKEFFILLLFCVINFGIAYAITIPLNIQNTILVETISTNYVITYEVILWFIFNLTEAFIYERIKSKRELI